MVEQRTGKWRKGESFKMAKRHVEGNTETKKVTLYNVLSQRRRQFEHSVDLC